MSHNLNTLTKDVYLRTFDQAYFNEIFKVLCDTGLLWTQMQRRNTGHSLSQVFFTQNPEFCRDKNNTETGSISRGKTTRASLKRAVLKPSNQSKDKRWKVRFEGQEFWWEMTAELALKAPCHQGCMIGLCQVPQQVPGQRIVQIASMTLEDVTFKCCSHCLQHSRL